MCWFSNLNSSWEILQYRIVIIRRKLPNLGASWTIYRRDSINRRGDISEYVWLQFLFLKQSAYDDGTLTLFHVQNIAHELHVVPLHLSRLFHCAFQLLKPIVVEGTVLGQVGALLLHHTKRQAKFIIQRLVVRVSLPLKLVLLSFLGVGGLPQEL